MPEKTLKGGISLVVPVFNEEELIRDTIRVFMRDMSGLCDEYEVIVVDDGSTDNTSAILRELSAQYDGKLVMVNNNKNLGSGKSLLVGFKRARFPLVATNFADRPFDLKELKKILPFFTEGTDFVVVSRIDRSANNLYRKLTSLVNYHLIRFLFRVKVGDFQFVQIYRKEILEGMKIGASHTFVPAEIIIQLLLKGCKMKEYKAVFFRRGKGKAKCGHPRIIFHALYDMLMFWVRVNFSYGR